MNTEDEKLLHNPFVGPIPFLEGQTLHGRKRETIALCDMVIAKRIVWLFSPSGAGKTSLIQAAVIPSVRPHLDPLPVVRLDRVPRTGAQANRYVLSALQSLETRFPEPERLPDEELRRLTISQYLECRVPRRRPFPLLVLDQFEELFTLDRSDWPEKRGFLEQLGQALGSHRQADVDDPEGESVAAGSTLWALLSMREDHVAELEPFLDLLPTGLAFRYRLEPLQRQQAIEAVTKTAAEGFDKEYFERDAAEGLVDDLSSGGRFVEPVHLQVVCRRLWSTVVSKDERPITRADLEPADRPKAMGGVDAALAAYYDDVVKEAATFANIRERDLREWIERRLLTRTGIRTKAVREPSEAGELGKALESLIKSHILRGETESDRSWIELSHDRLINPVLKSNDEWRQRTLPLFQRQAKLWSQVGGSNPELLFVGDALAEAERFEHEHPEEITESDRAFLAESRKERERIRRARRQRRWISALVATVVLGGLMLAMVIWRLHERSTDARETVVASQVLALAQRAEEQGANFDSALLLTVQAKRYADRLREDFSERISALSRPNRNQTLYVLADTLLRAQDRSKGFGHFAHLIPGVAASAAAVGANGTVLATGETGGKVRVWRRVGDAYSPIDERQLTVSDISSMSLDADARWLAVTVPVDRNAKTGGELWLVGTSAEHRIVSTEQIPRAALVTAVAVLPGPSARGPVVATGDLNGNVSFWTKAPDGWRAHDLGRVTGPVSSLAIGPRTRTVLAGGNGRIGRWADVDWASEHSRREHDLEGHDPRFPVRSMVLTDDERVLWSAGAVRAGARSVGGLLRWDLPSGTASPSQYRLGEFISALALADQERPPVAAALLSGRLFEVKPVTDSAAPPIVETVEAHTGGVTSLSRAGAAGFVSVGRDRVVRLWTRFPAPVSCPEGIAFEPWEINRIAVLPRGDRAIVAVQNGLQGGLQLLELDAERGIQTNGDDRCVASAPEVIPARWEGSSSVPISLAVHPPTGQIAVGTFDGQLLLYRLAVPGPPGRPRVELLARTTEAAYSLAFVSDQCLLVGGNGRIKALKLAGKGFANAACVPPPVPWKERVGVLASGGRWIAAGSTDSDALAVWETTAATTPEGGLPGLRARPLAAPPAEAATTNTRALAFSPDARFLSALMEDGSLRVWSTSDWQALPTTRPNASDLQTASRAAASERRRQIVASALGVSPDGSLIAASFADGHVRVWDVAGVQSTGQSAATPAEPIRLALDLRVAGRRVSALSFSPDGTGMVIGDYTMKVRVIPTVSNLMDRLCALAARNLTLAEWNDLVGGRMAYECTCPRFGPGLGSPAPKER